MARIFLIAALVLLATPAFAGPPFVTDDPDVVDYGHWEIDAFGTGTTAGGGQSGFGPAIEVDNGVAPDLMVHVIVPVAYAQPAGRGTRFGPGDIELGTEYRFLDTDNRWNLPEMATFPLLEVPAGDPARGLGTGRLHGLVPIWMEKTWGNWTSFWGGGYWINPGPGNRNYWLSGIELQNQITSNFAFGGEIFHQTANTIAGRATTGFNLGGTYDFSDRYHLLFSAGRGLQNAELTNRFSYYVAFQWTY